MTQLNPYALNPFAPWLQTEIPAGGTAPGDGQKPNYLHPLPRMLQRG